MKKNNPEEEDWPRPNYDRADLGEIVRGKYAQRLSEASNVVVLNREVAKAFPNDEAVNTALQGLIDLARSSTGARPRATGKSPARGRR